MDATTTQKGLVQLSSETESDSETLAATPRAVRAAYKLADGKYTAEDASTEQKGIVQLSSDTDSGAETFAATPKAVKEVMDETQKKAPLDSPDFTGNPRSPTPPLDASGNEIANAAFVRALIAELSGGREGDPLTVNHMQLQTGHKSSEPLVVKDMQLQSGYKSSEPLRVNHVQLQSGHKGTEPLTVNSLQLQRGHMSREPLLINHAGVHFAVVSAF
nr:phage tail protein [Escherichia coli]